MTLPSAEKTGLPAARPARPEKTPIHHYQLTTGDGIYPHHAIAYPPRGRAVSAYDDTKEGAIARVRALLKEG